VGFLILRRSPWQRLRRGEKTALIFKLFFVFALKCYNIAMLTINNLTKKFGNKTVVDQVSFSVKPGEIFSLIGPNGSGKTTIIKIIAGLLQPTSGEVKVGEADVTKEPEKAKAMLGYIPDEPEIWQFMTGAEFLQLTGALYSVNQKTREEEAPKLLDIFNLKGIERQYFAEYSRGNKQKFSILAALLHQPKLLLIDEPIVGLDPTSAEIAKREFTKFAQNGGVILLVTHTLSVAEEIVHRIGVLTKGRLVAVGTLDELRDQAGLIPTTTLEDIYRKLA
jgi:ABC-2 type transport system ATP-binding protein